MTARRTRFALVALLVVAGVVGFTTLVLRWHAAMPPDDPDVLVFDNMEFSADQGLSWQRVDLPHEWQRAGVALTSAWYRVNFALNAPPVALGNLYLPTLSQNVAVYLNGIEIGNGGRLDDPVARHWPRPLVFPIAPEHLQADHNELLIWVVSGETGKGMLGPVYLGDAGILGKAFANRTLLKVVIPTASSVVLSIFALLLCTITARKREDTQYAWGGCSLLFLAGHSLPLLVSRIPVPEFFWEWWKHVCIGIAVVCIQLFTHRFLEMHYPRLERASILVVLLATAVGLAVGLSGGQQLYYDWAGHAWGLIALLTGAVPMVQMSRSLLHEPTEAKILMLGAGSMLFLFGAHDALFVAGYLSMQNGYLVHFASPVVAMIFTAILFGRFAQASRLAEDLNLTLEQRIAHKSAELESTYERLQALERERLISRERERFNRDLHDGLGGYLAGALAMAERHDLGDTPLVATLKDATDEMRLMIDSAEASGDDLGMILGALRPKLERHLNDAGMQLDWQVHDTHAVHDLGPAVAMQLVRFSQEAVNNAVRHSGGSRLRIHLRNGDNGQVLLSYDDDGRCERTVRPGGHGMRNLARRAEQLDATLAVSTSGPLGGLSLTLCWQTEGVLPAVSGRAEQGHQLQAQPAGNGPLLS